MNHKALLWVVPVAVLLSACAMNMNTDMPGGYPAGEVAGILMAAHEGEIEQGRAASSRASSADVRAFAQMLVDDHTAGLNTLRETVDRAGVMAGENATSRALRTTSRETVTNLATYSGAAFDRRFMQQQVDQHQWVVDTIDNALMPTTRHREMRGLLENQRAAFAMHLERARTILRGL